MLSNSSNPAVAAPATSEPSAPSESRQSGPSTPAKATKATVPGGTHRALPYRPVHQLELLNLHAALDALLYQLNADSGKPSEQLYCCIKRPD